MAAACCPDDSWPALTDTPYESRGVVETLDESSGFKVYKVGAPNSKCIIWNYDIYGFEGGRTRKMADFVASQGKIAFTNISSKKNKLRFRFKLLVHFCFCA